MAKRTQQQARDRQTSVARQPETRQTVTQPTRQAPARAQDAEPVASRAARDIAEEQGVDLRDVDGSGVGGKIVKADVVDAEAPTVVYPLPTPPRDPNEPGPTLEVTRQMLSDADDRVAALEAKVEELSS